MEIIFTSLRWVHVAAGAIAFICGPIAILNQNGGTGHRRSGMAYFLSMLFIVATALILSVSKGNWFLLMIAIFTLYLISTGFRALRLKKLGKGQHPAGIDWLIWGLAILASAGLLGLAVKLLVFDGNNFGMVPGTFGFIMARGIVKDYLRFTRGYKEKIDWLKLHIGYMMGGYIATITAFLVQNVHLQPGWLVWLGPTIIFMPVLIYTIRKFDGKVKAGQPLKLEIGGTETEL